MYLNMVAAIEIGSLVCKDHQRSKGFEGVADMNPIFRLSLV